MRVAHLVLAAVLATVAASAAGKPLELEGRVEAARPAGCHDYNYLLWDLYRAELWSDASTLPGESFALSLTYQTNFTHETLVESSIEEMARLSGRAPESLAVARRQLVEAFRTVAPGDRITVWRVEPGRVRFFVNGRETGALTRDTDLFLDIWLGAGARHEKGRDALLAGRCDG